MLIYSRSISAQAGADSCAEVGQDNMEQYRSVAAFEAVGTGELSVVDGEIVTVIEKNTSGKIKTCVLLTSISDHRQSKTRTGNANSQCC